MTTTTQATYSPKMVNWLKRGLIRDGFIPEEDLSIASGSEVLRQAWLNVHRRSVNDVQHEIRVMWYQAIAIEEGISLSHAEAKVEAWIANLEGGIWIEATDIGEEVEPAVAPLNKEEATDIGELEAVAPLSKEETAARKIYTMANSNPVTKQILFYMLQGYPTYSVAFCFAAGIHTATMKTTVHNLTKAANCPKNEDFIKYLKRILTVSERSSGGWAK